MRLRARPGSARPSARTGDDLNQDFADRAKPVTFEPADLSVDLTPGTDSRLPLVAHLPRTLRPLDVYYVFDSTDSMDRGDRGRLLQRRPAVARR